MRETSRTCLGPFCRSFVIRIGYSQIDSPLGEFEGNLANVVAGMKRAERERVEIASFPNRFPTCGIRTPKSSLVVA